LVFIVMQRPPRDLNTLLSPTSKMRYFFDLLMHGEVTTEVDAAQRIYGSSSKDKRYLMLKRNLINKLTDIVLSTEYFDKSNYHSIRFECEKELTVAAKLLTQNVFHNAERILQRILNLSQHFQLVDVELSCLKLYRRIASMKGDNAEIIRIGEQLEILHTLSGQIDKSQEWVELLQSRTRYFIGKSRIIEQEAESYADTIDGWMISTPNVFLHLNLTHIRTIQLLQTNNAEMLKHHVGLFNSLLSSNIYLSTPSLILQLHYYQTLLFRMEGNLYKMRKSVEECMNLSDYKAFNRFTIQALHFDLLIKENNLAEAGRVLLEVKKQPQFNLIYEPDKSGWAIRKAYLFYALLSQDDYAGIESFTPEYMRRIDINALGNSCRSISKDKQGYNTMLMLIRVILMMEHHLDELHNEAENIRVYYYRHLRNENCDRTKIFSRALYKLLQGDFNAREVGANISEFNRRLAELTKHQITDMAELIPYQRLGEMVIKRIKILTKTEEYRN
jgi:hypothetical protein